MAEKKLPALGQVIIIVGIVGSLLAIVTGVANKDVLNFLAGTVGLVIFWGLFRLKPWSVTAVSILLSIRIIWTLILVVKGFSLAAGIPSLLISGFIIYYFNSSKLKSFYA